MKLSETDWFLARPRAIQQAILKYPPGKYKLKSTGHIMELYSYEEDEDGSCNTCTGTITYENNQHLLFERKVFDIPLEDLEKIGD